ncbi:hypothetical protein PYCCODRAFT_1429990 [Trametes coccinea BRFM310]|uniref:Uncharacterized protein n=1 Tax=Trametes coccinea (strain BRFM310) TaxID=1353009 RepID=A0A1Y2J2Y6_TRAC3|nr:hypothetical protein PYCCODRAFT_1429990 [Trametes coccinea BRFM310]
MPIRQLPQELIDEIIDAVANAGHTDEPDKTTLRCCALTARSWFVRARCHLFSTITLTEPSTVMAFTDLLLSSPSSISGLPPLSPVGHLVRHLRLGTPDLSHQNQDSRGHSFSFFTIDNIPIALLTNLATLSIAEVPELSTYPAGMATLCEDFRVVQELRLHRGFFSAQTITQLLKGFPQLVNLQLTYGPHSRHAFGVCLFGDERPCLRLPVSLKKLGLGVPDAPITEWLVDHGGLARNQLRSLSMLFQPMDDLHPLQMMLHHCGETLTELSVGFADPPFVLLFGAAPSIGRAHYVQSLLQVLKNSPLRQNNVLRTLRIVGCDALEQDHHRQDLYSWIPTLLQQIRSVCIEEVTLAFRAVRQQDAPGLSWIDWAAIDGLFEAPPLNSIPRLVVEIQESEVSRSVLVRAVAALLPAVAQRGALRIRCLGELPQGQRVRKHAEGLEYMSRLDYAEEVQAATAPQRDRSSMVDEYQYYQKVLAEEGLLDVQMSDVY